MLVSLVEREGVEAVRRDELSRMIFQGGVRAVFHPIVRLADGEIIGHEALTRPLGGISFDSVEELFAFAESTDLLMDFERLCRRTATGSACGRPSLGLLFPGGHVVPNCLRFCLPRLVAIVAATDDLLRDFRILERGGPFHGRWHSDYRDGYGQW